MNKKITKFYRELRNNLNTQPWRYGQTVFNTMYTLHPNVAQKYCGSPIDPFHNDDSVDEFIAKCFEDINEENDENSGKQDPLQK